MRPPPYKAQSYRSCHEVPSVVPIRLIRVAGKMLSVYFYTIRATIKRCVNSRGGEYPSGLT